MTRCQAKAKSGKPCGARPMEGGLCFFHANPGKAVELGRRGGRNHHGGLVKADNPLPVLDTAVAVRDAVARWVNEVYAGNLHPRKAAGLAPLMHLLLRAIETADMEQLKQQVAELREHLGLDHEPREIFRRSTKIREGQSEMNLAKQ